MAGPLQPVQFLLEGVGKQAAGAIHRNRAEGLGRQAHHRQRLGHRDMGIRTGDHHRPTFGGQTPTAPGGNQGHQVGEGAATGPHATTARGHAQLAGQPGGEAALQPGKTRGELLGEQVVVEAGADQIGCDGGRQGRGIQVGQGAGMVGVVGPIHHQLQIGQE